MEAAMGMFVLTSHSRTPTTISTSITWIKGMTRCLLPLRSWHPSRLVAGCRRSRQSDHSYRREAVAAAHTADAPCAAG
ncbi:hypothetical protein GMSM_18940 [Geomonas sp. Red276]